MADTGGGAPIIVTAELGAADQAWAAEALRHRHFPPGRNRVRAHITLFRHLPPSIERELRTVLAAAAAGPRPAATIAAPFSLGGGVAIAVRSAALEAIRADLAARFERHLTPQDRATPRLHVTVQNKADAASARATLALLAETIRPRPVEIAALACWRYGGGPWSPLSRHAFRG